MDFAEKKGVSGDEIARRDGFVVEAEGLKAQALNPNPPIQVQDVFRFMGVV